MIGFEWDSKKSKQNHAKHGLSFEEATKLWLDSNLLVLRSKRGALEEVRFLNVGKLEGKLWVAITALRAQSIRIISVRRARKNEVKLYES